MIIKDGQRGKQFCVVVDRVADRIIRCCPTRRTGSTERAIIRPSPRGVDEPLVAYLATDAGLPRRQLVGDARSDPTGWGGESGVLAPREDAELEGLDADDVGRLLLLVWNTAGGGSEIELLDTVDRGLAYGARLHGLVVSGALLSRDGSTALSASRDRGDRASCGAWTSPADLDPRDRRAALPTADLVVPTLEFFLGRDGLPLTGWLYRPRGADRARSGDAQPARRPGGPGTTDLQPAASGDGGGRHHRLRAEHPRLVGLRPRVRPRRRRARPARRLRRRAGQRATSWSTSGIADPARIAVTGRSYGGYLTLAMLAFSPGVFAAGVDICGMSDLHTFYRDSEPWIAAAAVSKYGDPEHDRMLLRATVAAGAAADHRRAAARRARRTRHQRPDGRGDPDRRRPGGARPAGGLPAARGRRPRIPPGRLAPDADRADAAVPDRNL